MIIVALLSSTQELPVCYVKDFEQQQNLIKKTKKCNENTAGEQNIKLIVADMSNKIFDDINKDS